MMPAAATLVISVLGLCTSVRPPPGFVTTAIKLHYPLAEGSTLAIQSSAARAWTLDPGITPKYTYVFCANVPVTTPTIFFRAQLNGTYSKGAAYRVAPGGVVDVYPYFNSDSGGSTKLFFPFHSDVLGNDRTVSAYPRPAIPRTGSSATRCSTCTTGATCSTRPAPSLATSGRWTRP